MQLRQITKAVSLMVILGLLGTGCTKKNSDDVAVAAKNEAPEAISNEEIAEAKIESEKLSPTEKKALDIAVTNLQEVASARFDDSEAIVYLPKERALKIIMKAAKFDRAMGLSASSEESYVNVANYILPTTMDRRSGDLALQILQLQKQQAKRVMTSDVNSEYQGLNRFEAAAMVRNAVDGCELKSNNESSAYQKAVKCYSVESGIERVDNENLSAI